MNFKFAVVFCALLFLMSAVLVWTPGEPLKIDEVFSEEETIQQGTRAAGGTQVWTFTTPEGEPISTPAIGDLDGDGTQEIVFASSGDAVYALDHTGFEHWTTPYSDDSIDPSGDTPGTTGLSFTPPSFFSSVVLADVAMGPGPEILIGVDGGLAIIDNTGSLYSKKGTTNGYYLSTPAITDLEGEWTGVKTDMEIIVASDADDRTAYVEAFEVDGPNVFRFEVDMGTPQSEIITCAVAAGDMNGTFEHGHIPGPTEDTNTEFHISSCYDSLWVYEREGDQPGGQPKYVERDTGGFNGGKHNYGSAAIGNISGNSSFEIIMGTGIGFQTTYPGWTGELNIYDDHGNEKWSFSTGTAPSAVFSSPAVGDVQMESGPNPSYEIFFGCDNGKIYCLDGTNQVEKWSFDTGGRILSSPALCNIDNDDELEVIIGSNSGNVTCFDADPSDGIDEGENHPGDGLLYDVLWTYDAGAPIGISSPVVADLDNDGQMEVIIGDTDGVIHCISAGGTSATGQSDWPKFRFDLNNTGFYGPGQYLPKIITPNNTTAIEDEPYEVTYDAINAPESKGFAWTMTSNASSWLSFNPTTRVLSGTPENSDVGVYWVEIKVDNGLFSNSSYFYLTVENFNDAPTIDTPNKETAIEDIPYYTDYQITDIDPTADTLTWTFTTNATFLSMTGNNLSGEPGNDDVGMYWVSLNLSDGKGGYNNTNFTLTVLNVNDDPTMIGTDIEVCTEDVPYFTEYNVTDIDAGDDEFTWTLTSDCTFLNLSSEGNLSGTPTNEDVGVFWVNVTVEDGFSGTDTHNFTLTVLNVNDRPYWVDVPKNVTLDIGDSFAFDVNASDDDVGDTLTYAISSTPSSFITIDPGSGVIGWEVSDPGTYLINISVVDASDPIFFEFTIIVDPDNLPPTTMLSSPMDGSELEIVDPMFQWGVTDPEDDNVTCVLYLSSSLSDVENLTEGSKVMDGLTDKIYQFKDELEKGETYYWTVIPSDENATGICLSGIWSFKVSEDSVTTDSPPFFTSVPPVYAENGVVYSYEPEAADPDMDEVTITLVSGPTMMVMDGSVLKWTPATADVGNTFTVNLSATANGKMVYQEYELNVVSKETTPDDDDDDTTSSLSAIWILPLILLIVLVVMIIVVIVIIRKRNDPLDAPVMESGTAIDAEMESDAIFKQAEGSQAPFPIQPEAQVPAAPTPETKLEPDMVAEDPAMVETPSDLPQLMPGQGDEMPGDEMTQPMEDVPQEEMPVEEMLEDVVLPDNEEIVP